MYKYTFTLKGKIVKLKEPQILNTKYYYIYQDIINSRGVFNTIKECKQYLNKLKYANKLGLTYWSENGYASKEKV